MRTLTVSEVVQELLNARQQGTRVEVIGKVETEGEPTTTFHQRVVSIHSVLNKLIIEVEQ